MSNALYPAECCGDLAECRRVAALCTSSEMRSHYLLLSEHYSTLAEAEELAALEQSPIRLTISRICQVCGAFSFGDLIETRGDGLAEACDGECAVLERI